MKDVQVWIKSALVPLAESIDNLLRLELVDLFKISSSFSSCTKSIGSKSLTAALLSPGASDFLMQDGYRQLSPHSHSATVAVESGSLSLPLPLTAPNKAEVLVEQRLGTLAHRYSRQSRPYHVNLFKKALVSILLCLFNVLNVLNIAYPSAPSKAHTKPTSLSNRNNIYSPPHTFQLLELLERRKALLRAIS